MADPEGMSPGVRHGLDFARWMRGNAQRTAREAGARGDYDTMMQYALYAGRWTVVAVGFLALAGCADLYARGEDSILEGFFDGGQRWNW